MGLIEQCRKRFFILQRIKKYLNQDGWILNRTYDIINMIVSLNRVLYNVFWNEGFRLHVCTSLAFLDQLIKSDWKWKSGSKLYNNIKKSYIITYYDTLHVWKQQMKKYLSTKIRQKQWYGHVDKKNRWRQKCINHLVVPHQLRCDQIRRRDVLENTKM